MAYTQADLINLAYGNGINLFRYSSTGDTLATVSAADYFLNAYRQLGVGDLVFIQASNDNGLFRVTASSSSSVTIATYPTGVASFGPSAVTSITVRNGLVTAIS